MPDFPKPDQWTHLALTWDETTGISFYVNGKLVATKAATGMFDAGLDQFGPHSRIIGPTGVESSYNFDRGGDIDEVRIYDRALTDDNIASLAKGEIPQSIPPLTRTLTAAASCLPQSSSALPVRELAAGMVASLWVESAWRHSRPVGVAIHRGSQGGDSRSVRPEALVVARE